MLSPLELGVDAHPLLHLAAFTAESATPLGDAPSPDWLVDALRLGHPAPLPAPDDAVRKATRDLLRCGGFKPSGRNKPASEFLLRAATRGELGSINLAVDLCNVASLHAGLPISVVDLDRTIAPLRVAIADPDACYVFNASGQEIRLAGLLCLHDAQGPCANAVKDCQRTKTHAGTRRTLCLIWGSAGLAERVEQTLAWYRELHARAGWTTALAHLRAPTD